MYQENMFMRSSTIAIHWHDDGHPVYSLDFQLSDEEFPRLATAGGDQNVRIWRVRHSETGVPQDASVEYLSTLRKHTQAVNAVRFDASGKYLASAGDDGMLIIWTKSESIVHDFGIQDDEVKESWVVHQIHSSSLEIYDICWSPDSHYVATGSMDNIAKIYNISSGQKDTEIFSHSHYVQGIAWDPLNEFLATQSADRSVRVHSIVLNATSQINTASWSKLMKSEFMKSRTPSFPSACTKNSSTPLSSTDELALQKRPSPEPPEQVSSNVRGSLSTPDQVSKVPTSKRTFNLYHSENLQSFFRRLAFSLDGSMLIAPLGIYKHEVSEGIMPAGVSETGYSNTAYIYTRTGLNQSPVCHLPGLAKPAIAVAFCPQKFESTRGSDSIFAMPYKMIFAVATQDAIIIYDTERLQPIGMLTNLHYLSITDLCWTPDGRRIMVSSAEGFCSLVTFAPRCFGDVYMGST